MRRRIFRVGLLIGSMFLAWALVAAIALIVVGAIHHGDTAQAAPQAAIPLRDAMERVRSFTEDSSLQLEGGLAPTLPGNDSRPIYWLESGSGERVDEFKVDAETGEILEAVWRSRLMRPTSDRRASIEDAALVASNFAAGKFAGFDKLTLLERSTMPAPELGSLHSLKWVQVDPKTRAELPTAVTISVASANNRVVRYLAQRDVLLIDTSPRITADQASTTVLNAVASDRRWRGASITSRRLQVIYDDVNHQRLAWAVLLDAPGSLAGEARLLLLVDAQTSQLIETN
jgi:hypothetical protein